MWVKFLKRIAVPHPPSYRITHILIANRISFDKFQRDSTLTLTIFSPLMKPRLVKTA